MDATNFTYWIKGALELGGLKTLNEYQVQIVQDHLNLVFNKQTPNRVFQEISKKFESPVSTVPFPKSGNTAFDITKPLMVTC